MTVRRMLIIVLALVSIAACAQTKTVVGNSITVAWDAPPLGAIPPAEISYEVVLQPYPTGTAVLVATTAALTQAVTFATEGSYRVAVRAKRTTPGGDIVYSPYLLSDVGGTPTPWYIVSYASPGGPLRIRIQ